MIQPVTKATPTKRDRESLNQILYKSAHKTVNEKDGKTKTFSGYLMEELSNNIPAHRVAIDIIDKKVKR